MNGYIGICRFCGQSVALDREYETEDAANIAASETCDCPGAKTERATQKQIEAGEHRVRQVFGDEAERLGFRPVDSPEPIELMDKVVALIARGFISSATINIRGHGRAKLSITSKEKIKVERSETRSFQLEK